MSEVLLFHSVLFFTSILAYLSYYFRKIQANVFVLLGSWAIFALGFLLASFTGHSELAIALFREIASLDFYALVVDGMLCYLLFAGCLHLNIRSLMDRVYVVLTLSVITTLVAFFLTSLCIYGVFQLLGLDYPMVTCLLYAAVIAPTDPIAVLALLKHLGLPKQLYAQVASESLLNDGMGVVLFLSVLHFSTIDHLDYSALLHISEFFLREAVGGLVLGFVLGYTFWTFFSVPNRGIVIDNRQIFLMLALLHCGFLLAKLFAVSPPLVAVSSGLYSSYVINTLSKTKQLVIFSFWDSLDEVLNYILFFLVGFEGFLVDISGLYIYLMLAAVSINFLTRLLSVGIPLGLIRVEYFTNHTLYKTLIVGGLKGGLSLALALSIPSDFPGYDAIFDMTYAVVAFTVIVQGFLIQRILVNLQEQRAVPEG